MATKKKVKTGMFLELNGKVSLVERKAGKRPVRSEIDGKLVLKLVLQALHAGMEVTGG